MAPKLQEEQQKKELQNEPGNVKWRDNGRLELTLQTFMHVSILLHEVVDSNKGIVPWGRGEGSVVSYINDMGMCMWIKYLVWDRADKSASFGLE